MIEVKNVLDGKLNASIVKVYPELEDVEITPTLEDQIVKSDMYGINEVLVKAIDAKEIRIDPTVEEQIQEGIFKKVIVGPMLDTSDATATAEDIAKDKTAYVNGEKVIGTAEFNDYNARINVENDTNTQLIGYRVIEFMDFSKQDVSKYTSFFNMFIGHTALKKVILPSNTSHITNINQMFYNCNLLEDFNYIDISGVTTMNNMFYNCSKLSDESLNNLLLMCANATSYTGTKTLKTLNLDSTLANKCTTLSNYQAFLDAGWTIGY